MRQVMAAKEDFLRRNPHVLPDQPLDPEFLGEPFDHRLTEDPEGPWVRLKCRLQDSVKLDERLLVKDHPVQVLPSELGSAQAELHRPHRKARVVLDPREAFLFRRCCYNPVLNQRSRGVMEEA